jgi:outer membrane biosynthesis protein TonB
MASSFGNGAYAVAPGFEGARITPEQAEALASGFLPSWESDSGLVVATIANGHGDSSHADFVAIAKSNGVHAETHAPPARTRVIEPEASVVIDAGARADAIAAPPPALAPASPPSPLSPPSPARVAPTVPPAAAQRVTQARPAPRPVARAVPADDYVPTPKSKKGLFIGLGVGAAVLVAIGIGFAATSGDSSKASDSSGTAITVVKPDETAKSPAALPAPTQASTPATAIAQATSTAIAQATATAVTTPPATAVPVTALPVAPPTAEAPKPKPVHTAASQPAYTAAPAPRPQPRSGGGTTIVKDVPF